LHATNPIQSPAPETIHEKGHWTRLYLSPDFIILDGIVVSISCTFSARFFSLQILEKKRAHVTFFIERDKLELAC